MKFAQLSSVLMMLAAPSQAAEGGVVEKPILATSATAIGQPLVLSLTDPQVNVSVYEIAPGTVLPEHRHMYPRYGYVLSGKLRVTYTATGRSDLYGPGAFVIEAVGQWHTGKAEGSAPVKLLVIDQVEKGQKNIEVRK
ncbi:cupin domain-containing protein [Bradyrhizobium sp. Ai1a-2]|uniref:cupin domain-containing protein n=1 Tax=Bradyrhizobium sp. Ai1a-2 TaxID=196490 RepID=UPI000485BD5A|nr:cupin domain-containing protein [Bradyrhizobium sp. Ai1a-2]